MISKDYFHAIDGRIRIHVSEVKGSVVKAREAAAKLMEYPGIVDVNANPTTGNVLIYYDPHRISYGDVLRDLRISGYLRETGLPGPGAQTGKSGGSQWSDAITRFALEALFLALTG